jgi:arabinose-5-phosphate isomerase
VGLDVPLVKALLEISQKGMGMTAVVDADGRPLGVFTDGDLRRVIERMHDFSNVLIRDVMHANPRSVRPEQLAVDAVAVMEEFRINQMLVIDEAGQLVGALHIHDLTRAKVI